jgi:undecaprenyl-diphosphatase
MGVRCISKVLVLTGTGGFAAVLLAVLTGATAQADVAIAHAIAEAGRSNVWTLALAKAATFIGDSATRVAIMVIAVSALVIAKRTRWALWMAAIGAGGALMSSTLKALVARPRPELLPQLDHATSAAFPSGHAWNGTVLFLSLALVAPARFRRGALVAAGLLALATGVSRVVLGVHWPTDVLAGWCGGVAWTMLWWKVAQRQHIGRFGR